MDCYCYTCERWFHSLGIARHRAAHRDKKERCLIYYSTGATLEHKYDSKLAEARNETP